MKSIVIVLLLVACPYLHAQKVDSSAKNKVSNNYIDPLFGNREKGLEIVNLRTGHKTIINKSRTVWIQCENERGKTKIKSAQIVSIDDDKVTFKPHAKNFKTTTYSVSDIKYIGFTTPGRIIYSTILNIILGGMIVIDTVIETCAHGSGGSCVGNDIFVSFRKNIYVYKKSTGQKRCDIHVVPI
ncbi:MAG TPA: hypothetical protein DGG95_08465 [Cytophagales bacterium]|jgi:hypothetical protein|nr:hypothetical protein [Cytophagales bacterium]